MTNQNSFTKTSDLSIDAKLTFRTFYQTLHKLIFGKAPKPLLTLEAYANNRAIVSENRIGLQAIAIDQIVGSVHDHTEFDGDFYPTDVERIKWTATLRNFQNDEAPIIIVIKVDGVYFVETGHEVVSVARVLNYGYLDANVIELELTPKSGEEVKTETVASTQITLEHGLAVSD